MILKDSKYEEGNESDMDKTNDGLVQHMSGVCDVYE